MSTWFFLLLWSIAFYGSMNQFRRKCSNVLTIWVIRQSKKPTTPMATKTSLQNISLSFYKYSWLFHLVYCCRSEWAWSEWTRQLSNREKGTFFFETQRIVVKGARNFDYARTKELREPDLYFVSLLESSNNVTQQKLIRNHSMKKARTWNLLTTSPILRSVRYIVFEFFVQVFPATL